MMCFIVTLVVVMQSVEAKAQPVMARRGASRPIDDATKSAVIDSVSKALNDVYVFPDVAKEMEKTIRKNLRRRAYKDLNTFEEFTAQLTADLFEIGNDKHLHVDYSPGEGFVPFHSDSMTDEERQAMVERLAYTNFGFARLERMAGNVGYLELHGFNDARWGGETAVAAMNFLANSDAIIIDLRNNGGGHPSMIQLISSYFFDGPVHLNSFYIRDEDKMDQFWTHAHVEGPRMVDVPLYILTSSYTFSAAEEFTYNMKNLERATIVGETTGGGAHPVRFVRFADLKVSMSLPFGRAINPVTGTNWEGTGVEPDIEVSRDKALEVAHIDAMERLIETATDEARRRDLEWAMGLVKARANPVVLDDATMQRYAGIYGPRTITYENGDLFYRRAPNPMMKMTPTSEDTFMFDDVGFFKLRVEVDGDGNPIALIGLYQDGHTDRTPRTRD
jgi:hypothetical protein